MSTDDSAIIFIDHKGCILDLDCTLGGRVIRSFLGRPWDRTVNMINIESLTLGLKNPHRSLRIDKMMLVEMKNNVLALHVTSP